MQRLLILTASTVCCLCAALPALAKPGPGSPTMAAYIAKLAKAKSLTLEFTAKVDDGAAGTYTVSFSKPNLARIDSPDTLIVLDGSNQTTYYKKKGAYIVAPQLDTVVRNLLTSDALALFAPFFDAGLLPASAAKEMGVIEIDGKQLKTVSIPMPSLRDSAIASFSPDDGSLKQATISGYFDSAHATQNRVQQCVLEAKTLTFSDTIDKTPYVFKAPNGARGISVADTPSDTWYTDLELAGAIAAATNRRIFVDFMATWCGPCKQLHDQVLTTDYFRSLSQYFVFVQIDVDKQSKVSGSYQVTAMPTQMVLDAQGAVLGKTVGYGSPRAFYDFLSKYAGG